MTQGIVIPAFGREGYIFAAYNLLKSIKHYNNAVKVHLLCDHACARSLPLLEQAEFDGITKIDWDFKTGGHIDPCKVKLYLYRTLPFDENLVLDADNVCLKDIGPLLDHYSKQDGDFYVQNVHSGKMADPIDYMWADHSDIWGFFGLDPESIFTSVRSASMWVRKGDKAKNLFDQFIYWYEKGFPMDKLKWIWGKTLPDELIIGGVLALNGLNADAGVRVDFLGNKLIEDSFEQIQDKYYLLSLFGAGSNAKTARLTCDHYKDWAERMMASIMYASLKDHRYKMQFIFRDKHANFV